MPPYWMENGIVAFEHMWNVAMHVKCYLYADDFCDPIAGPFFCSVDWSHGG